MVGPGSDLPLHQPGAHQGRVQHNQWFFSGDSGQDTVDNDTDLVAGRYERPARSTRQTGIFLAVGRHRSTRSDRVPSVERQVRTG